MHWLYVELYIIALLCTVLSYTNDDVIFTCVCHSVRRDGGVSQHVPGQDRGTDRGGVWIGVCVWTGGCTDSSTFRSDRQRSGWYVSH